MLTGPRLHWLRQDVRQQQQQQQQQRTPMDEHGQLHPLILDQWSVPADVVPYRGNILEAIGDCMVYALEKVCRCIISLMISEKPTKS